MATAVQPRVHVAVRRAPDHGPHAWLVIVRHDGRLRHARLFGRDTAAVNERRALAYADAISDSEEVQP